MTLITRETDDQGQPTYLYGTSLQNIAESLLSQSCLIFLGAGASVDRSKPDLPAASELSKLLAAKAGLEWHEYVPLSTIAFYYEFFYSRSNLNEFLTKEIDKEGVQPSTTIERLIEIIEVLEEANQKVLVVTTNYDQAFERAYETKLKRKPAVVIYKGGLDPNQHKTELHEGVHGATPEFWQPAAPTCLYKMHGCISRPSGQELVITEEDYINFLTNALSDDPDKRLLFYVRRWMALSTVLFIGYGLSDWNFRVIFKATAEARPQRDRRSYAVQYHSKPDDTSDNSFERARTDKLVDFWGRKYVDIINVDAAEFVGDLFAAVQRTALAPAQIS